MTLRHCKYDFPNAGNTSYWSPYLIIADKNCNYRKHMTSLANRVSMLLANHSIICLLSLSNYIDFNIYRLLHKCPWFHLLIVFPGSVPILMLSSSHLPKCVWDYSYPQTWDIPCNVMKLDWITVLPKTLDYSMSMFSQHTIDSYQWSVSVFQQSNLLLNWMLNPKWVNGLAQKHQPHSTLNPLISDYLGRMHSLVMYSPASPNVHLFRILDNPLI